MHNICSVLIWTSRALESKRVTRQRSPWSCSSSAWVSVAEAGCSPSGAGVTGDEIFPATDARLCADYNITQKTAQNNNER